MGSETIVVESGAENQTQEEQNLEPIIPEIINETTNETEIIEIPEIINETLILGENATGNISVQLKQYKAVINKPVKWIKIINLGNSSELSSEDIENLNFEIPKQAEEIEVKTEDEITESLEQAEEYEQDLSRDENKKEIASGGITGFVVSDYEGEGIITQAWNWFLGLFSQGITGNVIEEIDVENQISETSDSKIVDVSSIVEENNLESIAVEYITPGPIANETILEQGKRIIVSSEDEFNYTDILAYTLLDNTIPLESPSQIKLYWYATYEDAVKYGFVDNTNNESVEELEVNQTQETEEIAGPEQEIQQQTAEENSQEIVEEEDTSENITSNQTQEQVQEQAQEQQITEENAEAGQEEKQEEQEESEPEESETQETEESSEGGGITGEVISDYEGEGIITRAWNWFLGLFSQGITGNIIEEVQEVESENSNNNRENITGLELNESEKGFEITYGADELTKELIKIEINFTAYDLDEDGNVDYLEWNVPHLSLQIYDLFVGATLSNITREGNSYHLTVDSSQAPYDTLVSYWNFDVDWEDRFPTGKVGNAIFLDGAGDYISLASPVSAVNLASNYSVSMWIKPANLVTTGTLFHNVLSSSNLTAIMIYNAGIRAGMYNGTGYQFKASSSNLANTNWHHIVTTYNGSTLSMYLDNVLQTGTNALSTGTTVGARIGLNTAGTSAFNGSIDEAIIFNRTLSLDEITSLYNLGVSGLHNNITGGNVLDMRFEGNFTDVSPTVNSGVPVISTSAYDYSIYDEDATYTDGAYNGDGRFDNGLICDGSNDYLSTDNTFWQPANNTDKNMTWSFWMKGGSAPEIGTLMVYGLGSSSVGYPRLFYYPSTGRLRIQFLSLVTGTCSGYTATNAIPIGEWHQVSMVVGTSNIQFYVDGSASGSAITCAGNYSRSYNDARSINSFQLCKAGGGLAYYNGSMDEIMIFNTSLTSAQISAIYNNQSVRYKNPGTVTPIAQTISAGNNRVNLSLTGYKRLLGSNISARINYYNNTNLLGTTDYQNITDFSTDSAGNTVSSNIFYINENANNLTVDLQLQAGTNLFYSPIITQLANLSGVSEAVVINVSFVSPTTQTGNYSQNWIYANISLSNTNGNTIYLYNMSGLVNSSSLLEINFTSLTLELII